MGVYQDWLTLAQIQRSQEDQQAFWKSYFDAERDNYSKILDRIDQPYTGKLVDLAKEFNMEKEVFAGFIDGINSSLAAGEYDLDELADDSDISLAVDKQKLYYNMLDAKADWLFGLPQWEELLSLEEREDITKQFRHDKVFIAEKKPGRNDPCSCGSGKKYKNCCGAAV